MKDSLPSLYAYITTSLCVILFYILNWENSITVVKPVIIPAIYFYYWQSTKSSISIIFSVAIMLFFLADMVEIIDANEGFYLIMACSMGSYVIMSYFAIQDKIRIIFTWKSSLIATLCISLFAYFSIIIINQTHTENTLYYYFFILYTVIILSILLYAILRLFSNNNLASRLFFLMALVMLLSDILYASNKYVAFNLVLAIAMFASQFISYYFMVEYFNKRGSLAR